MSERIINVSPHLLMDVLSCESKAWFRHVKGFTSKGDAIKAVAGQAFHKAMEVLFDPSPLREAHDESQRPTLAVDAFHRLYDPAFARLSPDKLEPGLTPQNLDRVLRRWIQMRPAPTLPWVKVLSVEEAFVSREWVIDPFGPDSVKVRLIVRPDIVVEDQFGKIRWVDTKTTGWHITDESWRQQLRLSLQTQLYSDAIVQKYGAEKAIYAGWISAIELKNLPSDPARKCQTHKVVYAECGNEHAKSDFIECFSTEEKVSAAVREAEAGAVQFVRTLAQTNAVNCNVRGTANEKCRFCPGMNWCDSGRPDGEGALESYFVHEPWLVETGRR